MSHTRDVFRRLAMLGLALCVLIAGGTVAYSLVEHRNVWDGLVWTVDTVATTGSIQAPQDAAGEAVKLVLTFLGVGTLFYALVSLTELVVTGELGTLLSERRARRMTERLRDHYIVCGFGRVGRQVASDLRAAGDDRDVGPQLAGGEGDEDVLGVGVHARGDRARARMKRTPGA